VLSELSAVPSRMFAMNPAATLIKSAPSALAHQCHACRRHWALRVVPHPAGGVVVCRYCRVVRASVPTSSGRKVALG
jgi:hypothetical protein